MRVPEAEERLARQVVHFVQGLRALELLQGAWYCRDARSGAGLVALGSQELEIGAIKDSLGVLLKSQDDIGSGQQGPAAKNSRPGT